MSDIEFNGSEGSFAINMLGHKTQQTYLGEFKVKCLLSPMEEIISDRRYREILGTNSYLASEHAKRLAFALSQLEQRVIDAPPFWKSDSGMDGGQVVDDNVILEVLDKSIEAQQKYIEQKEEELKEKEKHLAEMIKKKQVEKEPEAERVGDESEQDDSDEVVDEIEDTDLPE